MNRNVLYLFVGAMVVIIGVLGYMVYQDRKHLDGLQISIGKDGLDIKGK